MKSFTLGFAFRGERQLGLEMQYVVNMYSLLIVLFSFQAKSVYRKKMMNVAIFSESLASPWSRMNDLVSDRTIQTCD